MYKRLIINNSFLKNIVSRYMVNTFTSSNKVENISEAIEFSPDNANGITEPKKDYLKIDVINNAIIDKLANHPVYGPIKDFTRLIILLRHNGIPSSDIINLLPTKLIHKLDLSNENWKAALDFLKSHGFNKTNRLKALTACPQLLEGDSKAMSSVINVITLLRSFNLFGNQGHSVLAANPLLMTASPSKINLIHHNLLKYFSKLDIQNLILKSPTILTDEWNETEKKIFYSGITMGISSKQISSSRYFKLSLRDIVTRHLFLERAGLFKAMKAKSSRSTSVKHQLNLNALLKENPSASDIFDCSDEHFATKLCQMTTKEFVGFAETLDFEIEEIELDLEANIRRLNNGSRNSQNNANSGEEFDHDDDDSDDDEDSDEDDDILKVDSK